MKEADAAAFRRDHLGFVFQEFNLLDTFSLEDNIYLPLVLAGTPVRARCATACVLWRTSWASRTC